MSKTSRLGLVAGATLLLASFATSTFAQDASSPSKGEFATQGYFATLLVDEMVVNVRETWTSESAIQSLTDMGMEPIEGWASDETLTEGTMVFLLRFVDIPIYTANPDAEVTVLEARSILKKFERHFLTNVEVFELHDGQTATSVDEWTLDHPSP